MFQTFLSRLSELFGTTALTSKTPLSHLDRSIKAAGMSHLAARRALAVAIAEEERETRRRALLGDKISDLEQRAIDALRAGREDLATIASEAIAAMETEVQSATHASHRFAAEVALARREVDAQRRRLADLDRGRRLVRVGAALNATAPHSRSGIDSFTEAETTLSRIEADNHDAKAIRDELAPPSARLIEQMSDLGFGAAIHVRPSDVLSRLRAKATGMAVETTPITLIAPSQR
ncbi:PspA/IM30 family protein [Bradyrhizobium prioriisuperbiae]|uniref:PspA/IM30 family protein n=1 Tax=Bradyrhizobium prioriisuperbiae TaxID=2854389 RepID=UPI0028E4BDE0|nr:PspA/IM30 family protein [Bradyrhizobium prioritasuperba]